MHDIKLIAADPVAFDTALARRGVPPVAQHLLDLDDARREAMTRLGDLQARKNTLARTMGRAKGRNDESEASRLLGEGEAVRLEIQKVEPLAREAGAALSNALFAIANLPADDVPAGADETGNVELVDDLERRPRKPVFAHSPRDHVDLGEPMGMDAELAAGLSGRRFVVLKGHLARLERALGQFMLDLHTREHGFLEVSVPLLVRDEVLLGTGQLPKFEDDLFFVGHGDGRLGLIPTAEVPLTNMVRNAVIAEGDLPMRLAALTPCFRAEAGAAGRDVRGMLRQHQFHKVEMVTISTPEQADEEHVFMRGCAEEVLRRLGLHYRVMALCAGDMGFSARRTWDIEVWLPGQNAYREIASISTCGDFQARRMAARYRDRHGTVRHVHTLNGSGLAVGRTLIAVLENFQRPDGSIVVPEVLVPYMGGITEIDGVV